MNTQVEFDTEDPSLVDFIFVDFSEKIFENLFYSWGPPRVTKG